MKKLFFESIIRRPEGQPYMAVEGQTTSTPNENLTEVIAQIDEDTDGTLAITLTNDQKTPTSITHWFPLNHIQKEPILVSLPKGDTLPYSHGPEPLILLKAYKPSDTWFPSNSNQAKLTLDTQDINLVDQQPIAGKISLWYPNTKASTWYSPEDQRPITHGKYLIHFTVEQPQWDADKAHFDIEVTVTSSEEKPISKDEFLTVINDLNHTFTFMVGSWTRNKIAIAWQHDTEPYRTVPVWAMWDKHPLQKRPETTWMPTFIGPNYPAIAEEILSNLTLARKELIERYAHAVTANNNGDWMSCLTSCLAILERLTKDHLKSPATHVATADELAQYLAWQKAPLHMDHPKHTDPNYDGQPDQNDYPTKAIRDLRNSVTAHWQPNATLPDDYLNIKDQALFYVEAAMLKDIAPNTPQWDRTMESHNFSDPWLNP